MRVPDIEVSDAQVHAWGPQSRERPWDTTYASNYVAMRDPDGHSPATVLKDMDDAGVRGAIIVPPSFEPDNAVALAGCREYPARFRAHARYRLDDPGIADLIRDELKEPGLLGFRMTFNAGAASWMQDGTVDWVWDFAEAEGIPISLFPAEGQLPLVKKIASKHSRLKLSIDHLGASAQRTRYDPLDQIKQLEPLHSCSNLALKVSALSLTFPKTYSPELVRTVIDLLIDWYGLDRLFWGSDYTREQPGRYNESLSIFRQGIAHLSLHDQRLVLGGALRDWFEWDT